MKLKTSTFVFIFALAVVAGLFGAFLFLNFAPFDWIAHENQAFGTTITTINGTDRITDSRTTINNNFSSLNTNKFELSDWYATTSAAQLTTLANLATVGTITSGTWSGTAVAATKGGTGQTTVTAGDLLYGSASNVWSKLAKGNDGDFLTLSSGVPAWAASAINQAANYLWSGVHNFTGSATYIKTLVASSTIAIDNGGSSTSWTLPTGTHASSTQWMGDASGNLFERYPQVRVFALDSNANASTQSTGTTTLKSITLPANTLTGTYKRLRLMAFFTQTGVNAACHGGAALGTGSASTTIAFTKTDGPTMAGVFYVDLVATTTSAIGGISRGQGIMTTGFVAPSSWSGISYPTTDLTSTAFLSIDAKCVNASDTIKLSAYSVEILSQ